MRRSTLTALIALALLTPAGVVAADPGTTPDFPVPMPHNDVELQDVLAQLPGIIEGLAQNRTDMAHCPEAAGGTVGTPENRNQPGRGPTEDDHGNPLTRHDRGQGPASLPDQVLFRSTHESYNRRYQFALRHGDVFYKSNTAGTGIHEPWARLALPSCLVGRVAGLSVDDDELVVVDADRWIFTMDGATLDPTAFNWSMRWGRPFWTGAGRTLPHHVRDWEWSVLSQVEDGTWQDTAGNRHQVGDGKVSHIWMLRGDGHRLTFIDPWLPPDQSYEMCGPHRGRFRSAALSVSGSTVFVIGHHGDLYTRLYDFDIAGDDPVFFDYSYADQRHRSNPVIQLPSPQWVRQPKIPGTVTDRISIEKHGRGAVHRTLRVEGRHHGRTGYWHKDITAARWSFTPTGDRLVGRVLDNPARDTSALGLAPSSDRRYSGRAWSAQLTVPDFNVYCTPAPVRVRLDTGEAFSLVLHTTDNIRQRTRARGLDRNPRMLNGTLEVPRAVRRSNNPHVQRFLSHLDGRHFVRATLDATLGTLSFRHQGWLLHHRPGQ